MQSLEATHSSQLQQQRFTLAAEYEAGKKAFMLQSARLCEEEVHALQSSLQSAQSEAETLRSDLVQAQAQADQLRDAEVLLFTLVHETQIALMSLSCPEASANPVVCQKMFQKDCM